MYSNYGNNQPLIRDISSNTYQVPLFLEQRIWKNVGLATGAIMAAGQIQLLVEQIRVVVRVVERMRVKRRRKISLQPLFLNLLLEPQNLQPERNNVYSITRFYNVRGVVMRGGGRCKILDGANRVSRAGKKQVLSHAVPGTNFAR